MRHIIAHLTVYVMTGLLLAAALLFALVRSQQQVLVSERGATAVFDAATTLTAFRWQELGASAYATNCRACHGADGRGWEAYPGVRGLEPLFNVEGGRRYLIEVMLYGLTGDRHTVPMPPLGNMTDAHIAASLNVMLTRWSDLPDDAPLYLPADIAAARGQDLSPWQVNDRRPVP